MNQSPLFGAAKKPREELETSKFPIEGARLPCHFDGFKVIICQISEDDVDSGNLCNTINSLIRYGYGRGTLSRGIPDYDLKKKGGLLGKKSEREPFKVLTKSVSTAFSPLHHGSKSKIDFGEGVQELTNENYSRVSDEEGWTTTKTEDIQLFFEECMYLLQTKKALSVYQYGRCHCHKSMIQKTDAMLSEFSAPNLWEIFCSRQPGFAVRYVVYHHYQSKKWVVRPGLKFGVDFLLYPQGGADRGHAQFGIQIVYPSLSAPKKVMVRPVPWILSRVLHQVAKNFVMVSIEPIEKCENSDADVLALLESPPFSSGLLLSRFRLLELGISKSS